MVANVCDIFNAWRYGENLAGRGDCFLTFDDSASARRINAKANGKMKKGLILSFLFLGACGQQYPSALGVQCARSGASLSECIEVCQLNDGFGNKAQCVNAYYDEKDGR